MSRLERFVDYAGMVVAVVASLLFGASFGWNYGVENQVVYLLGSLRLVHPDLLANDWFATQTTHYHPAFKYLAALLMAGSPSGFAVGVAQTIVIAAGMTGLYFLMRALVNDRRHALPGFLVLLAIATMTRTSGPLSTYVFDLILQPSTLGSAAFLVSLPFFVRGKWLASGIALAVSGVFHANYLILFFGAYALAHLALGKKDFKQRVVKQLGPSVVVLLLFMPMIVGTAFSKDAKEAQLIYATIRSPHHFVIAGHERDFVGFFGWALLGLGAGAPLAKNPEGPIYRLSALLCGLLMVIFTGVALSIIWKMSAATQLFSWRVVPHAEMVLMALACAVGSRVLAEPATGRRFGAPSLAACAAGFGALALWANVLGKKSFIAVPVYVIEVILVARVIYEVGRRVAPERPRSLADMAWRRGGALALSLFALVGLYRVLDPELDQFRKRSNVYTGLGRSERDLYAWMRENIPKDAILLTPPGNENLRFHSQRSIVVDWKSNPVVPGEVLEWMRRLEDVAGRKIRTARDLDGYTSIDEARVRALRERYKFDYMVVGKGSEKNLTQFKVIYSNSGFTVLDLRG